MASEPNTIWGFAETAVTIGGTLIAAWLGAAYTERQSNNRLKTEREHKLADDAVSTQRAEADQEARRASARLMLALHLETYAEACATTISDNNEPHLELAAGLPKFPAWPEIDWGLLGANETARVRDIEVRVRMRESFVRSDVDQAAMDADDAAGYFSVGAAKLGLDAWRAASELRSQAGVSPLEFPPDGEGWNYFETLRAELDRHNRVRAAERSLL